MLDMDTLNWEEPLAHRMKVERNLNFATLPNDEDDFGFSRKKTARDPMSHRIIEKRRRDRMNNCLADLSRLVPTNYLKKGRGRIEKTEIIEMAIKHLKHLQAHPCKDPGSCEVAKATEQDHRRQFRQGYQECMSETMKFMMEVEGSWMVDGVGIRLVNHLQKHYDKLSGGLCYTQALNLMASSEDSKSQVMEVDNHSNGSCFPESNNNSSGGGTQQQQHPLPASYFDNPLPPSSKVTSQLREMLQNPGVPTKDGNRLSTQPPQSTSSPLQQLSPSGNNEFNDETSASSHPRHDDAASPQPQHNAISTNGNSTEFCYKFKNTIKHRFNADLRHHHPSSSSSPPPTTDSHVSERMPSLHAADDTKPPPPLLRCGSSPPPHHAFSPYHHQPVAELLTVKIPDRTGSDGYGFETASSCGSNPSPPPARSSGSSSGYSTNGDNKGLKGHSPLSPYSPPPPPQQPQGVPVFALHPKGTFYIPLTLEASLLVPYMVGVDDDSAPAVLHPISICVNLGAHSVKVEKSSGHNNQYARTPASSSFLMDKFHDRLAYSERYYSCPPVKSACV